MLADVVDVDLLLAGEGEEKAALRNDFNLGDVLLAKVLVVLQ